MTPALEDDFTDVLGKALRGLGLSDARLAEATGLPLSRVREVCGGHADADALRRMAPVLGLDADALVALAKGGWRPRPVTVRGLEMFTTRFGNMTVNAYLLWDPGTRDAVAFDTGADCTPILDFLRAHGLTLRLILLTHAHHDHVADLQRLRQATGAPAMLSDREPPVAGAATFHAGKRFVAGGLTIETRQTWGHSPGGVTGVVHGLEQPVAVVGDALFAGSMGGGTVSYAEALRTGRNEIFTLPDDTVLCPGHGPMTTVGEERVHNPFFAGVAR